MVSVAVRQRNRWVGDVVFFAVFVPYAAVLVIWLLTGLMPALANSMPVLHRWLAAHGAGGGWWNNGWRRMVQASANTAVAMAAFVRRDIAGTS
jgi:hypothetical protein